MILFCCYGYHQFLPSIHVPKTAIEQLTCNVMKTLQLSVRVKNKLSMQPTPTLYAQDVYTANKLWKALLQVFCSFLIVE